MLHCEITSRKNLEISVMKEVLDGLFLGDSSAAMDIQKLREHGIRVVMCSALGTSIW